MKKHLLKFLLVLFLFAGWQSSFGQVFITELADPNNNADARYIELYNAGATEVVFTEGSGWRIDKYVNGASPSTQSIALTGTIPAKGFYIIAYNLTDGTFATVYGFAPDQLDAVSNGVAGANGDDPLELIDGTGAVVDQYGVPTVDGSSTSAEYEDGRAERVATVQTGQATYADANWNVWSDGPGGDIVLTQDAPADFDPGSWIGGADTDAPVATFDPADAAIGIAVDTDITITFDELIYKSDGTTEIVDGDLATLITLKETDAAGADVAFTATYSNTDPFVITITPDADLAFEADYYVAFGSVYDDVPNENTGENATFTTKPDTDKDSKAVAPVTQVAAANVESTVTDSIPVFSFTISDLATADGLGTKITQLSVFGGPNNTLDFMENLSGGYLNSESGTSIEFTGGPVSADELTLIFDVDALTVPDGEDSTYTVYFLLDNANVTDNSVIQLMIDADSHGFVANETGSEFAADFTTDIVGNDITVDVTATEIMFEAQPSKAYVGKTLNEVKVIASDANGNVDLDYVTDIIVTATGATLNNTPITVTPVEGLAIFDALSFSDAGTDVTLTAASGAFTNATSDVFDIVVEPASDLYFSEYIEGSSSNDRVFEIHNPTDASVDLSAYVAQQSHNGTGWGVDGIAYVLPLEGTLAAGEVYVVANPSASDEIITVADTTFSYSEDEGHKMTSFTGNDALGLFKIVGEDTVLIDVIGEEMESSAWEVAGVTDATVNHTLLRKVGTTFGNIDWAWSAGTDADNSEWKVFDVNTFGNIGLPTPEASTEAEILSFTFGNMYDLEEATITTETGIVDITVINGTDASALTPTFTISEFATVDSLSGTEQDFSVPFVYTVTAEDAVTEKEWTVNVTVSASLSTFADVLEMEIAGVDSVKINNADTSIIVYAPYAFDVTSVQPMFSISAGAVIVDTTAALDFSTPKTYTVTAQDGVEEKEWEVSIMVQVPTNATIYEIQYTTDASGDSPYLDQLIKTSGIVTGLDNSALYIQDGAGAWNGVYIYSSSTASAVALGDEIEFVAEVAEYYDLTELKNVQSLSTLSTGNDLPAVTTVTALEAQDEDYEGVYIVIEDAECTSIDEGNGMMEVTDGTGALLIDDDILSPLTLELGFGYDITGIGHYSFDDRKIIPRSANDIVNITPVISAFEMSPVTPTSAEDVVITATITNNDNASATLTNTLSYGSAEGSEDTDVTFTETATADIYSGTIPASTTTVYYKITASDGTFSDELTGSYTVTPATGISNPDGIVSMNIFPNPSSGLFTLEMNASKAGTFNIEIINIQGQVIYTKDIVQDGLYKDQIDMSKENSGIYYIRINDGNSTKVSKIMIQ